MLDTETQELSCFGTEGVHARLMKIYFLKKKETRAYSVPLVVLYHLIIAN